MKSKNEWAFRFFNSPDYLDIYHDMTGPKRTHQELGFCERTLSWSAGQSILDAPCGAGRHTLELARRGHSVVGLDFSEYLLELAADSVRGKTFPSDRPSWVRGLLQQQPFADNSFHHIICMFSSYGYGETQEDNVRVLREFARILRPGGKVLIDVMNRHFVQPRLNQVYESVQNGLYVREERTITDNGRRLNNIIRVRDKDGNQRQYLYKPWLFNGWELSLLAAQAGLKALNVYGNFHGDQYLQTSERAMLVAAKMS